MMLLNTSLLRERFIITENSSDKPPLVATGNRILLPLKSKNEEIAERFVIRAHSMHMALRMAAEMTKAFFKGGPLFHRPKIFWKDIWFDISSDFERPHHPETWIAIYYKGRPVYHHGDHHPFLDIIEQCDIKNRAEYDRAVPLAVDIFKQAGKDVNVAYDVNIGAVVGALDDHARCGLIYRLPEKTTTFNFTIRKNTEKDFAPDPHHALELTAFYLEIIQIIVQKGMIQQKIDGGQLDEVSEGAQKLNAYFRRIGRLNRLITSFEDIYKITYRPEKPNFFKMSHGTEDHYG